MKGLSAVDGARSSTRARAHRRRHVGRRRQLGRRGAAGRSRAMRSSASRCSSTITARPPGKKGACCAGQDIHDAARVAERLGIPALRARLRKALPRGSDRGFRRDLCARRDADPLHPLQRDGEVPRSARRGARSRRAQALATGHYARRVDGPDGPELHRAADTGRDQSYFLYRTTRAQLDFLRFPLGGLPRTRPAIWRSRFALPVARQARQPGHLLRARRLLRRSRGEAAPGGVRAGRDRGPGGPCAGPP